MGIMVILVSYQVFGRYVLQRTPPWTEEVVLLCLTTFGFLSIVSGFINRSHLSIEISYNRLSTKINFIIDLFNDLLVIAFGLILLVEGYKFTILTWSSKLPVTGLPNGIQYLIVPITGLIIIFHGVFDIFGSVKEDRH